MRIADCRPAILECSLHIPHSAFRNAPTPDARPLGPFGEEGPAGRFELVQGGL